MFDIVRSISLRKTKYSLITYVFLHSTEMQFRSLESTKSLFLVTDYNLQIKDVAGGFASLVFYACNDPARCGIHCYLNTNYSQQLLSPTKEYLLILG